MHTGEKAKTLWAYSPSPPIIQPCDGKVDDDLRRHLKKAQWRKVIQIQLCAGEADDEKEDCQTVQKALI